MAPAWSARSLLISLLVAVVLILAAVALVQGHWREALLVGVVSCGLAGVIYMESLRQRRRALFEARTSMTGFTRRLDQWIGPYVRRRIQRLNGYVYLGKETGVLGRWLSADPEHAVLVLGPPRQGKTSAVVVPTLLAASGPVVVTSTKEDVLLATSTTRSQVGTCWLFDPSGTVATPTGVKRLRWAPVEGCTTWDGAVLIAHNIVATSRPSEGVRDAGHWAERAEALLAPMLHAAALDGREMRQVMTWVLSHEGETPLAILERRKSGLASATLAGVARAGPNERAGIWSTAAGALAAYRSQAAIAVTDGPNFNPEHFVHSSDTIYIAAPSVHQKVTAPLIVALLEEIRSAAFARDAQHLRDGKRGQRPVLWLLDEVANIAPLPELPSIVSEGGGQGLVVLACLQDLSQARDRWGERAEGFFSLFGTKLFLRGLGHPPTLEAISKLAGEHEVEKVARSSEGNKTYTKERVARLPIDEIVHGENNRAWLFRTGAGWQTIRLTPWRHSWPWWYLVEAADRLATSQDRP
jgi:type IV secretion system protein VirD4